MPRIPTMSRAAVLKMQAKTGPAKVAEPSAKAGPATKKTKKKPAAKR
jgi:hypothetical protein